jgi:ubiquinone/menaquinone biosynthesis C-methylase UbiE
MKDNATRIKQAFEQPAWYLTARAYNIKLRAETIEEFLKSDNIGSILDIGCGDGSLSAGLLNSNNRLTLLDQSQTMLGIARSRVPPDLSSRVQTINQGFMEAALAPRSFDLVLCVGVLAYVEQRGDFIARIKSLLKPGGTVIAECSDSAHFLSRALLAYSALQRVFKPGEMQTVKGSSASVVNIFQELGFVLWGSFRYSLPLPVIRKLMSQKTSYTVVRSIFGTATRNRNACLGNECLFYFKLPGQPPKGPV